MHPTPTHGPAIDSKTDNDRDSPKLPHERDESPGSGSSEPRDVIRQAHDDVVSGKQPTDRGEATDTVYEKQKRAPGAPRGGA